MKTKVAETIGKRRAEALYVDLASVNLPTISSGAAHNEHGIVGI